LEKKCEPIDKYIKMSREALEKHDYDKAKSYAVLADMYNKRVGGHRDSEINQLRDEAGKIAGEMMASADSRLSKLHYFAAVKEYEEVASCFPYTDYGTSAKKKIDEVKQELRGKNTSQLMVKEAGDVFGEFMSYLMASYKRSGIEAQDGATVKATDIVKARGEDERKEVGEMIDSITSLYGRTEHGQKAMKLKRDLWSAGIRY
jgi:hypothetical protein